MVQRRRRIFSNPCLLLAWDLVKVVQVDLDLEGVNKSVPSQQIFVRVFQDNIKQKQAKKKKIRKYVFTDWQLPATMICCVCSGHLWPSAT